MQKTPLPTVFLAVAIGMLAISTACAKGRAFRAPTPTEYDALAQALAIAQGPQARMQHVTISMRDSRYANVEWTYGDASAALVDLLVRRGDSWHILYGRTSTQKPDGACAFAPAAIVHEFSPSITCPPWVALHARRATLAESVALRKAFGSSPLVANVRRFAKLASFCVSRLDARWASAAAELPDTGAPVWFHLRADGNWRLVYEDIEGKGHIPRPSVVLSLAACGGYNAAKYNS